MEAIILLPGNTLKYGLFYHYLYNGQKDKLEFDEVICSNICYIGVQNYELSNLIICTIQDTVQTPVHQAPICCAKKQKGFYEKKYKNYVYHGSLTGHGVLRSYRNFVSTGSRYFGFSNHIVDNAEIENKEKRE